MSAFIAFISDTTCTEESIESIENDYSLVLGQSGFLEIFFYSIYVTSFTLNDIII